MISGEALLDALRAVADGQDPDMVYIERYANADHIDAGDSGDA